MFYVKLTLQDVHPDQLRALRPTADLSLQIVLGLGNTHIADVRWRTTARRTRDSQESGKGEAQQTR